MANGRLRAYRFRGGRLEQMTEDHSLVESLVRQGRITAEEAVTHPQRNIITRALGVDPAVEVDSWELPAVPGDRYLLCSDGLFNEVEPATIAATLAERVDPDDAAAELVRLANEGGGRDNITCASWSTSSMARVGPTSPSPGWTRRPSPTWAPTGRPPRPHRPCRRPTIRRPRRPHRRPPRRPAVPASRARPTGTETNGRR